MAANLSIEVIRAGTELVMSGRLDVHAAATARTCLQRAIDDGVGELVVRVPHLEIWDASGLGVLVGAQRRARQAGRRLVLVEVAPRQVRLLRATRLHRALGVRSAPATGHPDPIHLPEDSADSSVPGTDPAAPRVPAG